MSVRQYRGGLVTAPHLPVDLHWLRALDPPPSNRHAAARAARAAIAHALHIPLEEHERPRAAVSPAPDIEDTEPDTRSAPAICVGAAFGPKDTPHPGTPPLRAAAG